MELERPVRILLQDLYRLQGPGREVAQGQGPRDPRSIEDEPDQHFGRDRDGQEHEVARQGIVAGVADDVARQPVGLVPDDLRVIGVQADVQAGQPARPASVLHELAGRGIVEGIDDEVLPQQARRVPRTSTPTG